MLLLLCHVHQSGVGNPPGECRGAGAWGAVGVGTISHRPGCTGGVAVPTAPAQEVGVMTLPWMEGSSECGCCAHALDILPTPDVLSPQPAPIMCLLFLPLSPHRLGAWWSALPASLKHPFHLLRQWPAPFLRPPCWSCGLQVQGPVQRATATQQTTPSLRNLGGSQPFLWDFVQSGESPEL